MEENVNSDDGEALTDLTREAVSALYGSIQGQAIWVPELSDLVDGIQLLLGMKGRDGTKLS